MTMVAAKTHFTPEDLLHLDGDGLFELVNGKLVEKQMGALESKTAGIITHRLLSFLETTHLAEVYPEATFQCFAHDPRLVRRPDVAVVTAERAGQVPADGHIPIAPDLAIEVISPSNRINEFLEKLGDYRSAGVKLVWEVNPTFRCIRIHQLDRREVLLEENDTITAEGVLPGFSMQVKQLLPAPSSA